MNINFNIKTTQIDMTDALSKYLNKRLKKIEKFVGDDESAQGQVELGRTTTDQHSGDIYRAEINLHIAGHNFRTETNQGDLYAAIDEVQEEMIRQVKSHKKKKRSLARKGAAKVKRLLTRFRSNDK